MVFRAATSPDKTMRVLEGATHYYAGQPQLLCESNELIQNWLAQRHLIE
jgi:hypothetical protein